MALWFSVVRVVVVETILVSSWQQQRQPFDAERGRSMEGVDGTTAIRPGCVNISILYLVS